MILPTATQKAGSDISLRNWVKNAPITAGSKICQNQFTMRSSRSAGLALSAIDQPTISLPEKNCAISIAAVSGASEPCTEFSPIDFACALRMVPSAALDGSVAPITSRYLAIGALAFQHLHHDRARDHEIDELAEERARLVHGIEGLGLAARHADALLRDDAKARLLDHALTAPVRLRAVASGLMIEKVRSIAIFSP